MRTADGGSGIKNTKTTRTRKTETPKRCASAAHTPAITLSSIGRTSDMQEVYQLLSPLAHIGNTPENIDVKKSAQPVTHRIYTTALAILKSTRRESDGKTC